MNTRTRLSLSSVALLVAAATAACGGAGGGAPTDASEDDFCKAQSSILDSLDIDVSDPEAAVPDEKDMADAMHSWSDELEKVGTPEGIPDDARDGFEVVVDQTADVSEDDLKSPDMSALEEDLSEDDKASAEAYNTYVTETCGSMLGDVEMPETPDSQ